MSLREDIMRVADIIAEELPATIDAGPCNSAAHQHIHELYEKYKFTNNYTYAAHLARREWIRETLTKHLVGEP
jgi:predicted Co/Zn/Cd cation transporter (cation efflux family)